MNSRDSFVLFDIGNTETVIATATQSEIHPRRRVPTPKLTHPSTAREWLKDLQDLSPNPIILVSTVVPAVRPSLSDLLNPFSDHVLFLAYDTPGVIGIDYPQPATIGADRLANATAALKRVGAPSIVVDFGTAVTFDVIDAHNNYIGGVIAPGLAAMTTYFSEKTALLPKIQLRHIDHAIGKNTEDAMLIGAVHGYAHMIRGLLQEVESELQTPNAPVILTGGHSELIAKSLNCPHTLDPNLTLEGLHLIALRNQE